MVASPETQFIQELQEPVSLFKPLFSAKFVADTMPGFDPHTQAEQSWNFKSHDSDGPVEITIKSKADETTSTIKNICGNITILRTIERPDRGIWEVKQYIKEGEEPLWSIGTILYFNGKFYEEINGLGIMPEITNASQAPRRTRKNINLDPQMIKPEEMWKWFQISRAFMRLEETLSKATPAEKPSQEALF